MEKQLDLIAKVRAARWAPAALERGVDRARRTTRGTVAREAYVRRIKLRRARSRVCLWVGLCVLGISTCMSAFCVRAVRARVRSVVDYFSRLFLSKFEYFVRKFDKLDTLFSNHFNTLEEARRLISAFD